MEAITNQVPPRGFTYDIRLSLPDSYSKMMHDIFTLALLITWLPSKSVSYLSPYIIAFYVLFIHKNPSVILNLIKIISIFFFFITINYLIRDNYIISNGILTIITYGSFLIVWALPKRSISEPYMHKIYKKIYFVVLFQSSFGILQFLIAFFKFGAYSVDMGDFIQGTIVPLSFNIEGDRGIGNTYFVINILILLLCIIVDKNKDQKSYFILAVGSLAVVLAGVHHALISVFLGLFSALYITEFKRAVKYTFLIIPIIVVVLAIFYFLNPTNVYLYSTYFNLYSTGESFKTMAMKSALIDLYHDHPNISILGTGLGQFSSRAGLIASGTYLGGIDENRTIPFFPIAKSYYFKNYAYDVYYSMKNDKSTVHGAASRTFFSLMSIYVELGIALFIGAIVYIGSIIKKLKNRYDLYGKLKLVKEKNIIVIIISGIFFYAYISFFENYLEMSQATLTCFIILKILHNNTFKTLDDLAQDNASQAKSKGITSIQPSWAKPKYV